VISARCAKVRGVPPARSRRMGRMMCCVYIHAMEHPPTGCACVTGGRPASAGHLPGPCRPRRPRHAAMWMKRLSGQANLRTPSPDVAKLPDSRRLSATSSASSRPSTMLRRKQRRHSGTDGEGSGHPPRTGTACIAVDLNGISTARARHADDQPAGGGSTSTCLPAAGRLPSPDAHLPYIRRRNGAGRSLHAEPGRRSGPKKVRVNCIQPAWWRLSDRARIERRQRPWRGKEEVSRGCWRREHAYDRYAQDIGTWRCSLAPKRQAHLRQAISVCGGGRYLV